MSVAVRPAAGRALRRFGPEVSTRRLICFHHAGGGPASYRSWPDHLGPDVAVDAVVLPGRDSRFREPPLSRMDAVVQDVLDAVGPGLSAPYALFGYSMGAQVAFHVALEIRARGLPAPNHLFVAASPGPSVQREIPAWRESDEELVRYVDRIGGTPPELLRQRDLLELTLPTLRADLTAVATCPYRRRRPLTCAIHAFSGADDASAPPEHVSAWARETGGAFRHTTYPGRHFFIETSLAEVTAAIAAELPSHPVGAAERGRTREEP